ncbi:MAG: NADPH:quinone reductase [Vicinamibacterales bacterium]
MHAIVAESFGPPEVLQLKELPEPLPGPGQVRVKIHAVGVNPFDTYMRQGGYAMAPKLPYTPGCDAAGVIDRIGEKVSLVDVGDRVYIGGTAAGRAHGAYASTVICTRRQVYRLAPRLSFAQGAAINVPYVTAWRALFERAQAAEGDVVLIHGASGAVGLAATQMARAKGIRVIGTAGTPEGMAVVKAQGAEHVLNHREPGYLDQVASLSDGGPDVIIEMLANQNLENDLTVLGKGGRIVVVGNRGTIEIDPRKAMGKDASILGMSLWNIGEGDLLRIHDALGRGFADGSLTPVVSEELPLAEAARAHTLVVQPGAKGKIVLIP